MRRELVQEQLLFVDSAKSSFRTSDDDFEVEIPSRTMVCAEDEFIEMEVTECTFRRDFYAVQNYNKHFSIYHDGGDNAYSLTEGNPTAVTIDSELKADFEEQFPGETFTVSWSSYTGKITIASTFVGTVPSDIALDTDVENSCHEVIGFSKKKHAFTIDGQNITLTGDRAINVLGEQAVFLRTSLSNSNYENSASGLENTQIVAKFPILGPPYSNLTFFNTGRLFTSKITQRNLTSFNVRLTNENNDLIGIQTNVTMSLTFRKYREIQDSTPKLLNEMLRLERVKLVGKSLGNSI